MVNSNEHLIKVTPVWAGYQLAHDGKHVPKLVFADYEVARGWVTAGKKGERGIMKVGFVGDVK